MKAFITLFTGLIMLTTANSALAQNIHSNHQIGVRIGGGITMDMRHTQSTAGIGVVAEYAVLNHHLEIEWAGILERHGDDLDVMETLALKAPWHLTPTIDLFFGLGLMTRQHNRGPLWSGGAVLLAGTTYWHHHWCVSIEMEYLEDVIKRAHNIEGLMAIMYRFGH